MLLVRRAATHAVASMLPLTRVCLLRRHGLDLWSGLKLRLLPLPLIAHGLCPLTLRESR